MSPIDDRLSLFSQKKKRNQDLADYILNVKENTTYDLLKIKKLRDCCNFMSFRHYYEQDIVSLSMANFCNIHLLCPLCAVKRAVKQVNKNYMRYVELKGINPELKLYYVVLTIQNGADLNERFTHMEKNVRRLLERRKHSRIFMNNNLKYSYAKNCSLISVLGGSYSFEIKRGENSKLWHPHCNLLLLSENTIDKFALSQEWFNITKDSSIVYVKYNNTKDTEILSEDIELEDEKHIFIEIFKYALKFSDMNFQDNLEVYNVLNSRKLVHSFGAFHGLKTTSNKIDLSNEQYEELVYMFMNGRYRQIKK